MPNAIWPAALPQNFFLNLVDQRRPGFEEFPVDAGLPIRRRTVQYAPGSDLSTPFLLTSVEQRVLFDDFFANTLSEGNLPFDWIHPVTGLAATYYFKSYPRWTQNPIATGTLFQGTLDLLRV